MSHPTRDKTKPTRPPRRSHHFEDSSHPAHDKTKPTRPSPRSHHSDATLLTIRHDRAIRADFPKGRSHCRHGKAARDGGFLGPMVLGPITGTPRHHDPDPGPPARREPT